MKTLSLLICLLGLTFNVFAHVDYQLRNKTMMELAVQHFNKDHSKELTTRSDEFKFMSELMTKLGSKFPEHKDAVIREAYTKSFNFLDFRVYVPNKEAKPEDQVFFQKITDLVVDCSLQEVTTITKSDYSLVKSPIIRTNIDQRFRLNVKTPYNTNQKVCSSPLVSKLMKLNATMVRVVREVSDYGIDKSVEVEFGYGIQDMGFKLNQLKSDPEFSFLSEKLTNSTPPLVGGGSTIRLQGSTGKASFTDPLTLVFVRGWGDCPAGCINHEYTTIEVTPKNTTPFDFDFKVIPTVFPQ